MSILILWELKFYPIKMAKGLYEKIIFRIREGDEDYDSMKANEYFAQIQKETKKRDKKAKFFKRELKDRVEFLILEKPKEVEEAIAKNFISIEK